MTDGEGVRVDPNQGAHSDEQLMAALRSDDRAAMDQLFARYAPVLIGLMARDLARVDAEDLVQETFLQLYRARLDFKPGARLRPWLMTIALNLKRDLFRRRGRRPEHPMEAAAEDARIATNGGAARREARRTLERALAGLPARHRQAIELHWVAGLSFPEVAQAMGAKLSAVKVWAHRGYKRLRTVLEVEQT